MASGGPRVVITGMGAVSCLGHGVSAMWEGLAAGRCGIGPLARLNAEEHRIKHAGEVPPLDAPVEDFSDLAIRYAVAACAEALDQARLEDRRPVALVLGSNFGAMARTERLLSGARAESDAVLAEGPTRIAAKELGLEGVQSTVSLSCASGNAVIGYAADLIRSGRAEIALAAGYDAISEIVWAGLCSLRAMTADKIRPFDRRRDGTIFSEGAGALLLESADHALKRAAQPLALFLGYATSNNAFHMTYPDPDGAGMARAMRDALQDSHIAPDEVDHINAHATGTPSNDKLETAAIKTVFGPRAAAIPINGLKAMLGHAMGAAGALEAIATVLTIRTGIIPPTINLEVPDPDCDLDYTPSKARRAAVRTAMNNSAGFGGCNASAVFRRWEG